MLKKRESDKKKIIQINQKKKIKIKKNSNYIYKIKTTLKSIL